MKGILTTIALIIITNVNGQSINKPVFISGQDGHKSYRIPAIIALPTGELLAFCEGRINNSGDFGDVNIVLKKSRDKGKTWGVLQTVVDYNELQAGNPAPVIDRLDPRYPEGRIFLFYNTGNNQEDEVRKGRGLREVWYKTSIDAGTTWSEPVNITTQVHRPKQPQANAAYNFSEDWRSYANTPGHAVQLTGVTYKGRMFIAANHSAGEPQKKSEDYRAHGFYTDDHGKTFHLSTDVNIPGGNESTATELSNNKLMMNLRNQQGDKRERIIAVSGNGGASWDTAYFDSNLPDPVCQGSILWVGRRKGKNILAFCNNAAIRHRDSLALRISYDDGVTWNKKKIPVAVGPKGTQDSYSAYSDLVKTGKNKVGILFEYNNYAQIVYTEVKW